MKRFLSIQEGIDYLRNGEIIAYPTEAVFGLGCCALNHEAIAKLLAIKQRSHQKGLILIASALSQLQRFIDTDKVEPTMWAHIQEQWPGPYTWVFPPAPDIHPILRGSFNSVAVRVTAHPLARALCEGYGGAIVSTSANLSGTEPLKEDQAVYDIFKNLIGGVVKGQVGSSLKPTSIQNALTGEIYR